MIYSKSLIEKVGAYMICLYLVSLEISAELIFVSKRLFSM